MDNWPAATSEELPWHFDGEGAFMVSKSRRRKIAPTYRAAIPAFIADERPSIPGDLRSRLSELRDRLVRFDERQARLPFNLPSLLLRSESSASSQIENLTSSARNVALAQLSANAPQNARIIAGNIEAMKCALSIQGPVAPESIRAVHRALMGTSEVTFGGQFRQEPVWVGGDSISPHGAIYVPPVSGRVPELLDDLCAFTASPGIDPIVKAALAHAQFESIHPFIDGNGRTGRTLLHSILREEEVLVSATVPISAGLLHNVDSYMRAITAYQQGDPVPIVEQLVSALDLAIVISQKTSQQAEEIVADWREAIREREGSSIYGLPYLLVGQPVVDSRFVAERLGITRRAAMALINRACDYGILRPMGNARRGDFYQADAMIALLEDISSISGIRRLMA